MTEGQLSKWRENITAGDRRKEGSQSVVMSSAIHTYIMVNLSRRHISQVLAARICGCSPQFLNRVIMGRGTSREIQNRFATLVLGLRSWEELEWRALSFQDTVAKTMDDIPSSDSGALEG